jgi:hypothetical protein
MHPTCMCHGMSMNRTIYNSTLIHCIVVFLLLLATNVLGSGVVRAASCGRAMDKDLPSRCFFIVPINSGHTLLSSTGAAVRMSPQPESYPEYMIQQVFGTETNAILEHGGRLNSMQGGPFLKPLLLSAYVLHLPGTEDSRSFLTVQSCHTRLPQVLLRV